VTVVPVDAWGRAIDPRNIRRIDSRVLASLRPTLDPLTLTPLRNAVIHSAWGRGKIDLPPGIAKKLRDTPVYVGNDLRESRSRKDVAKWMRVERVSDQARNEKFKIKDERGEARSDNGRKQEADRAGAEAAKANKEAGLQRKETRGQDRSQEKAEPKARGERVSNPNKPVFLGPPVREAKPDTKEHKHEPAQPAAQGQGHGGGKAAGGQDHGGGKGKGKGKP